jgi:hypothetical protein
VEERRYYRKVVQIEILSEEPIPDMLDLDAIHYGVIFGDWSGLFSVIESTEHTGKEMAALLLKHGSEPSFFRLTEKGEMVED